MSNRSLLEQLQIKYPEHEMEIQYRPKSNCSFCKGTGEKLNEQGELTFCVCTCVWRFGDE